MGMAVALNPAELDAAAEVRLDDIYRAARVWERNAPEGWEGLLDALPWGEKD